MNRRELFGLLSGLATGIALIGSKISGGLGFVDVDRWVGLGLLGTHRVLFNGRDITDDCHQFNDREGWALVYKRNDSGKHYVEFPENSSGFYRFTRDADGHIQQHPSETPHPAQETLYGRIEVVKARKA